MSGEWGLPAVSLHDSDPLVNEFVHSMPEGYRELFDQRARKEHAYLVQRRGDKPGYAAVWTTLPRGLSVVCVTGDDHPGLLSVVTTVFVLHRLDVVTAQVFCRRLEQGKTEAVDFFWVRQKERAHDVPPNPDHLERCVRTITGFLRAGVEPEHVLTGAVSSRPPEGPLSLGWDDSGQILTIQTPDGAGLLMAIAKALHESHATILSSEIRTEGSMANDRFELRMRTGGELDDAAREVIAERVQKSVVSWQQRSAVRSTG
jgi:UTP:GlnB (protein PII) uridylyltransferase